MAAITSYKQNKNMIIFGNIAMEGKTKSNIPPLPVSSGNFINMELILLSVILLLVKLNNQIAVKSCKELKSATSELSRITGSNNSADLPFLLSVVM